jgi:NitT/TauT family transport system ATP-binding protein
VPRRAQPQGSAAPAPGAQGVLQLSGDSTKAPIEYRDHGRCVGLPAGPTCTLLRLLLGQEAPGRGAITVDGAPLANEPGSDRGIVFQRYSVYPHLSGLGNVALGLEFRGSRWLGRLLGARRRRAFERAQMLLQAVGLAHVQDAMPASLWGGMQQRVAIAQALILEPRMLLRDEPFGALDPGIRNDMHELVIELWRKSRMAVFMVTHNIREAFKLGTRVLTFDKVRIDPTRHRRQRSASIRVAAAEDDARAAYAVPSL